MRLLHGIGVLVTRPAHQAMPLCRLLEAEGANPVRFPALEIKPLDRRAVAANIGALPAYDLIVFTSANAVRFGAELLGQKRDLPLAVIGPATARALNREGYRVAVQPAAGFDSEGLLQHPQLHTLTGKRVLLVKGSNGRELLQQELARRGAQVTIADVYRREPAAPSVDELAALQSQVDAGAIQFVTATSVEIADGLRAIASPALGAALQDLHWVVPGARVAAALRGHGVQGPILEAQSADDQDVVSALLRWRAGESGA